MIRPLHTIPASMESDIAEAFDEWIREQDQETKEIARLHLYNLRANMNHPGFGEKAAKCLLAITYLKVDSHLRKAARTA